MIKITKRIFVVAADQARNDKDLTFWQKDEPLSQEAQKIMDNVYLRYLAETSFVLAGSSHFTRAIQAGQRISGGGYVSKFDDLDPISEGAWDLLLAENPGVRRFTDRAMFERRESRYLLLAEGKNLLRLIKSMADRIEMGQNVLLICSRLFIESAMAQTEDRINLRYLENGDVVLFQFEENKKFVGLEILPSRLSR
ncbi:MAG: hypothetical protein WC788_02045 [Candidatus Paceibacterota bacterium]